MLGWAKARENKRERGYPELSRIRRGRVKSGSRVKRAGACNVETDRVRCDQGVLSLPPPALIETFLIFSAGHRSNCWVAIQDHFLFSGLTTNRSQYRCNPSPSFSPHPSYPRWAHNPFIATERTKTREKSIVKNILYKQRIRRCVKPRRIDPGSPSSKGVEIKTGYAAKCMIFRRSPALRLRT